jgi:hypothetical protein
VVIIVPSCNKISVNYFRKSNGEIRVDGSRFDEKKHDLSFLLDQLGKYNDKVVILYTVASLDQDSGCDRSAPVEFDVTVHINGGTIKASGVSLDTTKPID